MFFKYPIKSLWPGLQESGLIFKFLIFIFSIGGNDYELIFILPIADNKLISIFPIDDNDYELIVFGSLITDSDYKLVEETCKFPVVNFFVLVLKLKTKVFFSYKCILLNFILNFPRGMYV